jgi:hypothetical protein
MPVVDVRRRWSTKDPAARTAALILERSLTYVNSTFNFKDVLNRAVDDYILPGRSVAFVCYEPVILNKDVRKQVEPLPPSEPQETEPQYPEGTKFDEQGAYQMQSQEYKAWESVYVEYVPWDLFGFSECKQWSKVPALWIGDYLTKGDIQKLCPDFKDYENLSFKTGGDDNSEREATKNHQPPQTVLCWKVWHKDSRKFMVFAEGYQIAPLLVVDDPTQLENFYPVPEPMYSLRNNNTWEPKAEYLLYQDQAIELDIITERMTALVKACKNRGVYDQAMDAVAKISELPKKGDNEYIPVPNFSSLAEKGGLEGLISTMPLQQIIEVIAQLREREQELKAQIYEIYGIADIMRGASKATETLGAQQLKAQYGALRISTRQERFQEFVREIFRIEAELIAEHFDPDTLRIMCGIEVIPDQQFQQLKDQEQLQIGQVSETEFNQAIQIIRSDKLRGFKVDIETDSTVPVDKDSEQQNRVAFITALGTYLQGVIPAVQSGAIPVSVAREAMLFVVRGFKVGTELEEVLEELGQEGDTAQKTAQMQQMLEQCKQQLQQLQQENQQLKSGAQVEMQKAQIKAQSDQQVNQSKMALEQQQHEQSAQLAAQVAAREEAAQAAQAEREFQLEQSRIAADIQKHAMALENERIIADARNQTAIQVAEISAKAAQTAQARTAGSYESEEQGA